ncbi:MAG: ABC transporter permease subunit [Cyanobacteria bacterium P01_E01_bin.42]
MFWNLALVELEKIVKRPLFLFLFGLFVGLIIFVFLGGLFAFELADDPRTKLFFQENLAGTAGGELALGLAMSLGGLSLLILTAAIATSEYQWRTLHLYLSHGVSRTQLLQAKFTALTAIALLFVLVSLVLGLIFGIPLTIPMGGEVKTAEIGRLFLQGTRVFLAILPCIAIAFPIAILTRSLAITNTITLLYVFILEPVLTTAGRITGEPLSRLTLYLPFQLAQFLIATPPDNIPEERIEEFRQLFVDPNVAAFGLTIWLFIFAIATWLLFRRQDLTS